MIDMIRVGKTRNLLRTPSSLLEIWTRSAHHHPGQRRQVSRTNRPDKRPHSITCSKSSDFPCKPSGIHKSRFDGRPVSHSFTSRDRQTVDEFHAAALAAGGQDNGPPGMRVDYHPNYYGAFVLDPDGHNIEAVCHRPL